jgi:hypothetical protein
MYPRVISRGFTVTVTVNVVHDYDAEDPGEFRLM